MKVLQINSVCGTGSTGRIAVDISKVLFEHGIDNKIFFGIASGEYHAGKKFGSNLDLRSHQLVTRFWGTHGMSSSGPTKKMIESIREYNPDVIHLHNIHGFYLNTQLLFQYLKHSDKPVVWTMHDCWAFTGHCAYFDMVQCDKWKKKCYKCPALKSYPVSYIFDKSTFNFEKKKKVFTSIENLTLVTPSKWLKNQIKESFLSRFQINVIHNGIDLSVFRPLNQIELKRKYHLEKKKVILGVTSQGFSGRKGLNHFIALARNLDSDNQIILIGIDEKDRKQIPSSIIGITRTENIQELAEYYSLADVFVNPTLEDNFPTVNLESLACGTPVITFNTGGSPEAVDQDTGMVIERDNNQELFKAIQEIVRGGKLHYTQKCRDRAVNYYSGKDRNVDYIKLYRSIL
ncbi:MAG: glycosyltransferase [Prolixibacteraceae bacterium]